MNSTSFATRTPAVPSIRGFYEDNQIATEKFVHELSFLANKIKYHEGDHVIAKGMESNSVYYVQTGAVEVFHTIRDTKIVMQYDRGAPILNVNGCTAGNGPINHGSAANANDFF